MEKQLEDSVVVQRNVTTTVKEQFQQDKAEDVELERRKSSVIIHGILESKNEVSKDRIEDDKSQLTSLFIMLNCEELR